MRSRFWVWLSILLLVTCGAATVVNLRLRASLRAAELENALLTMATSPARLIENLGQTAVWSRDGQPASFADYMDERPLMIGLFRLNDCQPCLRHFKVLDDLQQRFGDRVNTQLAVVGDTTRLRDVLRSSLLPNSPVLLDLHGGVAWSFNNVSTPALCFVDTHSQTGIAYPLLEVSPEESHLIADGFREIVNACIERSHE